MYHLSAIIAINEAATKTAKLPPGHRDCSFCVSRSGVILHSAALRSTSFLSGKSASTFLRKVKGAPQAKVNRLIESSF